MKVLIAEDEPVSRRVLEKTLTSLGYEVVVTKDGGAAWEALQGEDSPQIAILDWMMPEMDGLELTRKIRSQKLPHYIFIIMITAKSRKQDIIEGMFVGADDCLTKPFDPDDLYARIRAGERIIKLEQKLSQHNKMLSLKLEEANQDVYQLVSTLEHRVEARTLELAEARDQTRKTNAKLEKEIAERGRLYEALEESEKKYRTIVENVQDVFFQIDFNKKISEISPSIAGCLGYTRQELIGKPMTNIFHSSKDCKNFYAALRKHGEVVDFEVRLKNKKGDLVYTSLNSRITADSEGNHISTEGSFRDITERRRAQENQANLLKELESANQELKHFADIVSHDLKAPLRAISSLASWIATDYAPSFDEDGKEQMNLLTSRVKRMHDLIDGILQYSRVGRVKEELVEVNLSTTVPEIIDMLAPPENIEIRIENELPTVLVEKTRISQVSQNLLSNAIKYMDKPKGKIKVRSVRDNGCWKFSVADNGPGIEKKYFEKIFQIFQTLQPRDVVESTGVGLSVVQKIVKIHGGKIWLESRVGNGSTFYFTLPS